MARRRSSYKFWLIAAALVVAGFFFLGRMEQPQKAVRHKASRAARRAPGKGAVKKKAPGAAPEGVEEAGDRVEVAIIIDDLGSDPRVIDEITGLKAGITVAVLPRQPYSADIARKAKAAGLDVLLHLPMQPKGAHAGLGAGALMEGMGADAAKETVAQDLASVPGAVGVNNHMGSALTEDRPEMKALMAFIKSRGLYFVDSRTTGGSVAYSAAVDAGVRAASRDVFLDDSSDRDEIRRQFKRLIEIAEKEGAAIAIGHPRPATLAVLKEELPVLEEEGIEVVGAGRLVR